MTAVEARKDFTLWVKFQDGTAGTVEMRDFVHAADAGVFSGLADPDRFAEVHVDFGVVTWPGEIDLAPDAMHQAIREAGRWVVT